MCLLSKDTVNLSVSSGPWKNNPLKKGTFKESSRQLDSFDKESAYASGWSIGGSIDNIISHTQQGRSLIFRINDIEGTNKQCSSSQIYILGCLVLFHSVIATLNMREPSCTYVCWHHPPHFKTLGEGNSDKLTHSLMLTIKCQPAHLVVGAVGLKFHCAIIKQKIQLLCSRWSCSSGWRKTTLSVISFKNEWMKQVLYICIVLKKRVYCFGTLNHTLPYLGVTACSGVKYVLSALKTEKLT